MPLVTPDMTTTAAIDQLHFGDVSLVSNWIGDYETSLTNSGFSEPKYFRRLIEFAQEYLRLFPEDDENTMANVQRSAATAMFKLGLVEEGEARFAELMDLYPDDLWVAVNWGDCLADTDKARARKYYDVALQRKCDDPDDRQSVLERIADLGW